MSSNRETAAAYVLGELDERRRTEFERALRSDPALAGELEALRTTLGQLEEMPPAAWPSAAGNEPGESPATVAPPRRRRALAPVRPAIALGLALAALVLGGALGAALWGGSDDSSPQPVLTLSPLDAPARSGAEISMPDPETMLLRVHGLPHSGPGQYYEVWLMSDAASTVPVASFRVGSGGDATVEVPLPADPTDFRYFDVSRQRLTAGTGHSGDSVLRGSTAAS